ncbi:MAG: hypothetical protein OES24_07910 [Acidimicrobiia bacterium]|nr:hypothetical protein [Acidimicrobiia bacterium]
MHRRQRGTDDVVNDTLHLDDRANNVVHHDNGHNVDDGSALGRGGRG